MRTIILVFLLVTAPAAAQYPYDDPGDRPSPVEGLTFREYCQSTYYLDDEAAGRLTQDANFNCSFYRLDEREAAEQADALRQNQETVDGLFEIIIDGVGPVE